MYCSPAFATTRNKQLSNEMPEGVSENELTLAPLVREQWRWFRVGWFDPRWKQSPLVRLVPQVLVKVCIRDLLQWLDVIDWNEVTVQIHELYAHLNQHAMIQCHHTITREIGNSYYYCYTY